MSTQNSEYDFYIGGHTKTPDFAIYYNLAKSNLDKLERSLSETERDRILANYLWKSEDDARNSSDGYIITAEDIGDIKRLKDKLEDIRNYHSHIWHSNEPLAFNKELKSFVEDKHKKALATIYETNPSAVQDYEEMLKDSKKKKNKLFNPVNGKFYITEEGRVFFLSFFLTTGQMSRFLQQRKGSKRNDLPLFKVKHLVYKYYCHRDGASIADFNQEEKVLDTMAHEQKANIIKARKAYKLISYLHDYPISYSDPNALSLILSDNERVTKVETVQDLWSFITKHELLPDLTFSSIAIETKHDEDSKEEFVKNRTIAFKMNGIEHHSFHINFENLYKLALLCFVYGNEKGNLLKDKLTRLVMRRKQLYDILLRSHTKWTDEDHDFLADKANRNLQGYKKLTTDAISFFDDYDKWRTKAIEKGSMKLANMIRQENIHAKVEKTVHGKNKEYPAEPIIVFAHDFIEKTEQKFRPQNLFVQYAVHYLIDNNLTENWYWEVETFEFNEKKKEFRKDIPNNYRLSIEDGHVTVGIPKGDTETLNHSGNRRYASFYQFSLGLRAIKYLLTFHLQNKEVDLDRFLSSVIKNDMGQLVNGQRDFQLLEERFLAQYLKKEPATHSDINDYENKLTTKVQYITEKWLTALDQSKTMKRAEKNRIIMEVYKFFDWPTDKEGQIKFFRANEYNLMSICHYSLGAKNFNGKKPKWKYLFEDLFKLQHRKPAIPRSIIKMLEISENLDDLLRNVICDRQIYLENTLESIAQLSGNEKKTELIALGKQLGIATPENWIGDNEINELKQKRKKTLAVLPFPIHPILLLKHFEPDSYKADYVSLLGTKGQANRIFERMRSEQYTSGLFTGHYNMDMLSKLFPDTTDAELKRVYAKEQHKWVKTINNTLTEDAILWEVAKTYLKDNDYTKAMAEALVSGDASETWHVGNLNSQEITLPLKQGTGSYNQDDVIDEDIYFTLRMHQLDDVMYYTEKEKLRRAALHYLRRMKEENTFWESVQKEEVAYMGTKDDPIPYEVLRRELQMIAQHGIYLAGYLLDWERVVINNFIKGLDKAAGQKMLKENSSKKGKDKYHYLNFDKVITLDDKISSDMAGALKGYRKRILHSGVPIDGSFAWWCRPDSEAGTLLGVTEPIHIPKDRTKYLENNNQG